MKRASKLFAEIYGVPSFEKLTDVTFDFDELSNAELSGVNTSDDLTELFDSFLDVISQSNSSQQNLMKSLLISDKRLCIDLSVLFKQRTFSSSLESFTLLSHDDTALTESIAKNIGKNLIGPMKNLTYLNLQFCKSDFSQESLKNIFQSIRLISSLQTLECGFRFAPRFDDEVLKHLCDSLRELKNLQHLKLDLDSCKITNEGLIYLGQSIVNCMPELLNVDISVSRNSGIDLNGFKDYFEIINQHKNNKNFSLKILSPHDDPTLNPNYLALSQLEQQQKKQYQQARTLSTSRQQPYSSMGYQIHWKQQYSTNTQISFFNNNIFSSLKQQQKTVFSLKSLIKQKPYINYKLMKPLLRLLK